MDFLTLVMLGIGLAMDCLAVALAAGMGIRSGRARTAIIVAASFGGFQAGMTFAGWALGDQFYGLISGIDHWVAFLLLVLIGVKMIVEAAREEGVEKVDILHPVSLLVLSIATSIDALAVGLSLAFLQVDILPASVVIGIFSFIFAFAGIALGGRLHRSLGRITEVAGGVILVLIGARILIEHLFP
ncbi:MAG: manganese efflux pump MntP family protein [Methanoregulaceae archaeon]|nr:manganese efflux pump MntP family protein [Methanoregulaceae archaeon]